MRRRVNSKSRDVPSSQLRLRTQGHESVSRRQPLLLLGPWTPANRGRTCRNRSGRYSGVAVLPRGDGASFHGRGGGVSGDVALSALSPALRPSVADCVRPADPFPPAARAVFRAPGCAKGGSPRCGTIRRLLGQTGAVSEIIVWDGRSTDRTREVLEGLATGDCRVRVRRGDTLPDRRLGKCHACHLGAGMATGEWLLFTDADGWFKPGVIERAVRLVALERREHLTLTPGLTRRPCGSTGQHDVRNLAGIVSSRVKADILQLLFGLRQAGTALAAVGSANGSLPC